MKTPEKPLSSKGRAKVAVSAAPKSAMKRFESLAKEVMGVSGEDVRELERREKKKKKN